MSQPKPLVQWGIPGDERIEEGETSVTRADTPRRRPPKPTRNLTATRLGHFQLLEPLGHGGMGTVYSAYDLRLDRKVAIKVLSRDEPSPERDQQRSQRLVREAQAMAKLSHPNVVPVYEVGIEDGTVFIAMEYVPGKTLSAWLKAETRSWRDIARVFAQAGRGLAAAHEVGIVHRDFKPANVLVDDKEHVRVVDFGVAQVRGVADPMEGSAEPRSSPRIELDDELTPLTPSTPLTEQGSLVGTPAYMSPEQYQSAAVDARSDQFSFCVALYEALYGKRPHSGRGKTLAENVKAGVVEKPDGQVPGWVTAVVMRGLSTEPDKRFASMTELCAALELDPGRRRRRIALGVAAVAVIAGGATFVGSQLAGGNDAACSGAEAHLAGIWDGGVHGAIEHAFAATHVLYADSSAKRVEVVLDQYAAGWVAMRGEACRATRVRGEQSEHVLDLRMACLDDRLGELRALTSLLGGHVDGKVVEHAVDAASALTPVAGCADTSMLLQAGSARHPELLARLDDLLAAKRVREKKTDALAAAKALVADARAANDARVLAQAIDLQGVLETDAGDLKAAQATLAEAMRRARQTGDPDLLVQAATDLVDTLGEAGISTSREALGVARVGEALVSDTHDPVLPLRLELERADEYMTLAHPETALPILETTLEQAREMLGPDHTLVFQLQSLYASALSHMGKFPESRQQYDDLIASATRVLGALHPTTVMARLMRCRMIGDSGSLDQAPACFAETMPDAQRVFGPHDRELLSMRAYHGFMLFNLGKLPEARAIYQAAYADVPADAWSEQFFVANDIARTLGVIDVELGDYPAGLEHCKRAEETTEQKHRGPVGATCIGQALLGLGKPAEALAALEPLVALVDSTPPDQLGVEPSQIGAWRFAYAQAVWAVRHQADPARALATKARSEAPARAKQIDAFLQALH